MNVAEFLLENHKINFIFHKDWFVSIQLCHQNSKDIRSKRKQAKMFMKEASCTKMEKEANWKISQRLVCVDWRESKQENWKTVDIEWKKCLFTGRKGDSSCYCFFLFHEFFLVKMMFNGVWRIQSPIVVIF